MTRHSKYNAQRVQIDGITFDSRAEGRRYGALCLLQRAGEIRDLQVHPVWEIQPAFTDHKGKRHQAITYEADFQYWQGQQVVLEDVKGHTTAVFRLKQKLFSYRYPGIELRVIPASEV